MKKIDKLILSRFLGPMVLTFFITLFIMVMQFLWKYIDDLVGKGLELNIVAELIFYASASFVPLALPLAVLLASIMTFGNLGENYELVATKSSGVSLFRTMQILIITVFIISLSAFYFSNNILPIANLKFGALLYDITQQKPALNIKEGVFYNGIEGFSIKVGRKDADNITIHDVIIYDHTSGLGNDNVITAKKGEMRTTEDERYMVLKLFNGRQYKEVKPKKGPPTFEHLSTEFIEYEKTFDLTQFSLDRTKEDFWKNHYQMLSLGQLTTSIDTLEQELEDRYKNLGRNITQYYAFKRIDIDSIIDTTAIVWDTECMAKDKYLRAGMSPDQEERFTKRALSIARNVKSFIGVAERDVEHKKRYLAKHQVEWHRKLTLSVACLVLFFIGAPLGAIIRMGGLGMPMVVSILFFAIFHVLTMMGEKLAEESVISPLVGMWLATFVLSPIGMYLTYKAMNDSQLLNIDRYFSGLNRLKWWVKR